MDAQPPYRLNAHQQIAWDCEVSAVVLGKGEEHVLIPTSRDGVDEHAQAVTLQIAKQRGYEYCGVMGYGKNGECLAQSEPTNPGAVYTMMFAAFTFARLFIAPKLKGDSVDWLERIFQLPDPRAN